MKLFISKSDLWGTFKIPGSKSHTIRALFLSSLAEGESTIRKPLISDDARSAVRTCEAFGAEIEFSKDRDEFRVKGFNGMPKVPKSIVDVGNSGTTLRIGLSTAALVNGKTIFTGDEQIKRRPLANLLESINDLGAKCISTNNNGCAPVEIFGRAIGGSTQIDAVTSQFLTSLLINTPFLEKNTEIRVTKLNEKPYVDMTLWWLDKLNIKYENNNFERFYIPGNQKIESFQLDIPGDFSSATFFMILGAISGNEVVLENLDITDTQGDKKVLYILEEMGAEVKIIGNTIKIKGGNLKGMEIDMNDIPDALPAMAVVGTFAEGETRLLNVPQARIKETDRITVMYEELKKLGADIEELEDGLIIRKSTLKGTNVNGHHDHRVVMSLAIAGLNIQGQTIIDTAEAMNVTFPQFFDLLKDNGGNVELY